MLDELVSLSFSDDGVAAATTKVYKKRAHEAESAIYREDTVINDPALPDNRFTLSTTQPKATNVFYGTRRISVNFRHERVIPIPGGTGKFPVVVKCEFSIPVGVSGADIEYDLGAFRAFIMHDIAKRLVKTMET